TGPIRLVVFGGSQGARIMADIVPPAVERLARDLQARLAVVQQAREEDLARVTDIYARARVAAEVAPLFADLPARIASSPMAVGRRSGGPAGGRPSWCRCPMRSTRINPPMPACWSGRAGRCACARTISRPIGWRAKSPRLPARRKSS